MKNFQKQKEILFIIPARSGSKGVKNKNLKLCAGESLLRRAVKIAINISLDDFINLILNKESILRKLLIPILKINPRNGEIITKLRLSTTKNKDQIQK